jgi:nucleotide-binding universal stress UspA family protein
VPEFVVGSVVSGVGRVIVGASGSPGSLCAVRYALAVAGANAVPLVAVLAWVPPGGDLAERRCPNQELRRLWAAAAQCRLEATIAAACGGVPPDLDVSLVVIRGEPGPSLIDVADSRDDLLVIGAGRRGRSLRWWRGKVGRFCLAHAGCPVLAIPNPGTPRELGLGRVGWSVRHRELTVDQALRDWVA